MAVAPQIDSRPVRARRLLCATLLVAVGCATGKSEGGTDAQAASGGSPGTGGNTGATGGTGGSSGGAVGSGGSSLGSGG
ncbi:MAG TPA: hypothetical protein VI456_05235, partial [Polyangia bacterium]